MHNHVLAFLQEFELLGKITHVIRCVWPRVLKLRVASSIKFAGTLRATMAMYFRDVWMGNTFLPELKFLNRNQELARRGLLCAFLFGDSGVRALYHRRHLENIVLPAIDLVLLETGFDAGSNHRVELFSIVLGLHPSTQIVFSSPPDTYPGVEAVPRTGDFNDGRNYPDLPYRQIRFVQKLVSAILEGAENVAFNAREVKFHLKI